MLVLFWRRGCGGSEGYSSVLVPRGGRVLLLPGLCECIYFLWVL